MVHICSWCEAVDVGKGGMRSQVIMRVLAVAVSQRRWWRRALVWRSPVSLFSGACGIVETKINVMHVWGPVKWLTRRRCADCWLLKLDTEGLLPSSRVSTKPGGYGSASTWLRRLRWRTSFGSGPSSGHIAAQAEADLSQCYSSWWCPEASSSNRVVNTCLRARFHQLSWVRQPQQINE